LYNTSFNPYSQSGHSSLEVVVDLTFVESMRGDDILRILDTKAKKLFFDGFEVVLIKNFIVDIKGRGQNGTEFK
jgi:hypothetical protein